MYRKATDVVDAPVGEGTLVMRLDDGLVYALDRVGSVIWQTLETTTDAMTLAGVVSERFEVAAAHAMDDIGAFLLDMAREGLVVPVRKTASVAPARKRMRVARRPYAAPQLQRSTRGIISMAALHAA